MSEPASEVPIASRPEAFTESHSRLRVAAVQAASVFLDLEATTEKACALIAEAGAHGADFVVFPEGFIPAHPTWPHFFSDTDPKATELGVALFDNAVEVPGPETARLAEAARKAGAYVVVGICERASGTDGSLYNSQIYFGPDGSFLGKHQKLVPTAGERLHHTGGDGDTLGVFQTSFGPASSLICSENSNPLALFVLAAQHTRVHAMSWPQHLGQGSLALGDRARIVSQAFAISAKCHVVSACGVVDERMIERIGPAPDDVDFLRGAAGAGGSVIVAPSGKVLAGPLGAGEGILVADIDVADSVRAKLREDFAGHSNRADVFSLYVNHRGKKLVDEPPMHVPDARVAYPARDSGVKDSSAAIT